eukprot:gene6963-12585_t
MTERAEGWEGGRAEGWKSRRVEEQKGGRAEGWKSKRVEEQKGGRAEGWKSRRVEEQKGGRAEGWKGKWKGRMERQRGLIGGKVEGWMGKWVEGQMNGRPDDGKAKRIDRHKIVYKTKLHNIKNVVDASKSCRQFFRIECHGMALYGGIFYGFLVDRNGQRMDYIGGGPVDGRECNLVFPGNRTKFVTYCT